MRKLFYFPCFMMIILTNKYVTLTRYLTLKTLTSTIILVYYKTSIRPFSVQRVEASTIMYVKEHGYLQVFFRNNSSPLPYKDITAF
jgi:hypothetical protein